ncbi:uncharacterized protein IL334_006351 [Kwoniella shivajii]|uniref:Uncharacterized protein n=1 Tax=Kwoniella shivajii TaxID=564305 RepID=A0ABZ1D5Q7_9TREE|nr:hypothetical protein IL334_006351 [Kwoniella shivajii]
MSSSNPDSLQVPPRGDPQYSTDDSEKGEPEPTDWSKTYIKVPNGIDKQGNSVLRWKECGRDNAKSFIESNGIDIDNKNLVRLSHKDYDTIKSELSAVSFTQFRQSGAAFSAPSRLKVTNKPNPVGHDGQLVLPMASGSNSTLSGNFSPKSPVHAEGDIRISSSAPDTSNASSVASSPTADPYFLSPNRGLRRSNASGGPRISKQPYTGGSDASGEGSQ